MRTAATAESILITFRTSTPWADVAIYLKRIEIGLRGLEGWGAKLRLSHFDFGIELQRIRVIYVELEMWANAQRDGRPAEYRWRPLFNAAKFG